MVPRNNTPNNTVLQPNAFESKSLRMADINYSNTEREGLSSLYGLETFHHYCFIHEVSMIIDHKPLVTICGNDASSLSHRLHRILLWIHQYNIRILYKTEPQLFIADVLSRHNHETEMKKHQAATSPLTQCNHTRTYQTA